MIETRLAGEQSARVGSLARRCTKQPESRAAAVFRYVEPALPDWRYPAPGHSRI